MNTAHFFDQIFRRARKDAILILNRAGEIRQVNAAFTTAFGYSEDNIRGQHLRVIFTDADRQQARPEKELEQAAAEGTAFCDCYVLHKDGAALCATGELFFVGGDEEACFVKIIHPIGARKLLDKFVFEKEELVDMLFHSLNEVALAVIDTRMNVLRSNSGFKQLFGAAPHNGEAVAKLLQFQHPLWKSEALRQRMRELIVQDKALTNEEFRVPTAQGGEQRLAIRSKAMEPAQDGSRNFLLLIHERKDAE